MDLGGCLRFSIGVVTGFGGIVAAALTVGLLGAWVLWPRHAVRHPVEAPADLSVLGIDVSHHQGAVDWDAVARSGRVSFAFVKATEGVSHRDRRFAANWKHARRVGIPVGAYHYLTLCTDGAAQARHFIARVPKEPGALPPVVDVEPDRRCNRGSRLASAGTVVTEWIDAVEAHYGQRPLVYSSAWFHRRYLSGIDAQVWAAAYSRRPRTARGWLFWQFTDRGSVPGVSGRVDWNAYAGSEAELRALAGPGSG